MVLEVLVVAAHSEMGVFPYCTIRGDQLSECVCVCVCVCVCEYVCVKTVYANPMSVLAHCLYISEHSSVDMNT